MAAICPQPPAALDFEEDPSLKGGLEVGASAIADLLIVGKIFKGAKGVRGLAGLQKLQKVVRPEVLLKIEALSQAGLGTYDFFEAWNQAEAGDTIGASQFAGQAFLRMIGASVSLREAQAVRRAALAAAARHGAWDLHPFQRGRVIEQQLGQNLPRNFPTIDRFQNGVATSVKSMDLVAPTYANAGNITSTGRGYIDSVAGFQGRNWAGVNIRPGDITARGLDLAVPAGATQTQQQALQGLITYGTQNGVTVRIVIVP